MRTHRAEILNCFVSRLAERRDHGRDIKIEDNDEIYKDVAFRMNIKRRRENVNVMLIL